MNKLMKSFRIDSVVSDDLAKLAAKYDTSQSDIIEKLVNISYRVCFDEGRQKEFTKDDFEWFFTH